MLSRAAEAVYWIGRYLERAENLTRLILVNSELAVEIEGLDDSLAQSQWDEVLAAVGADAGATLHFSRDSGLALPYIRWLLVDEKNPVSVSGSVASARRNARSVREVLTREVFVDLNQSYRDLQRLSKEMPTDPVSALDEVGTTHRGIRTILGSIEHTLSRNESWNFMKLGEAIERTQRTVWLLNARLPGLGALHDRDLPLVNGLWRALLTSVSSLDNYRFQHGANLKPDLILRFLLFEPTAPRSVRCGMTRILRYLERLPRGTDADLARNIMGRVESALRYEADEIFDERDPILFCQDTSLRISQAHDAITRGYFRA